MTVQNSDFKVLIIGAGVAGLSLAQILRKAEISFEIFERDDGTRSQGWSISLDHCLERIEPLLADDLTSIYNASSNRAVGKDDGFAFYHAVTHDLLGVVGNVGKTQPGHNITANRNTFRRILMEHLPVQFGKRFSHYEEDERGIRAHFTDGTSSYGNLLVGADGANSPVRGQLLDNFVPDSSTFIAIHGNVTLSKEDYEPLLRHGNSGLIIGHHGLKFYLALLDYLDNGEILFNWNCCWESKDPETDHVWAQNASREELFDRAMEVARNLPPFVVKAIESTRPSGIHQPPVKLTETLLPDQGLPKGRVTLMGDSAHSMVPFRGMGANTGILDACELGERIIDSVRNERDLAWALQCYERVMIPRGRTKMLESRATGESGNPFDVAGGRLGAKD